MAEMNQVPKNNNPNNVNQITPEKVLSLLNEIKITAGQDGKSRMKLPHNYSLGLS